VPSKDEIISIFIGEAEGHLDLHRCLILPATFTQDMYLTRHDHSVLVKFGYIPLSKIHLVTSVELGFAVSIVVENAGSFQHLPSAS
jgi:hypothetical protein